MGRAATVSDRALRYRANQAMPADAPEVCSFCGSTDVEVGHLDGFEENNEPSNLSYTCRPCNVKCGNTLKNAGRGRRTVQFNPSGARSAQHYRNAIETMLGQSRAMALGAAIGTIQGTSHAKRAQFARPNPGAESLGAYMAAIADHRRGAHDAGGRVIHATPKNRRSRFARDIAKIKKQRYGGGDMPDWVTNPAKKNPAAAARDAYERFHGERGDSKLTIVRKLREHEHVAGIGELRELWIVPLDQEEAEGRKDRCIVLKDFDGAWLTQSENEKVPQLFIDGGDQAIDDRTLRECGIDPKKLHESECLGKGVKVVYYTNKTHLGREGGQADYHHEFGETRDDDGRRVFTGKASRPLVLYDTVNHLLFIAGGKYTIPPEGISD